MDAEEETLRNERRLNALLTIHRQLTDLLEFVNRIGVSLETLSISTVRFIADQNLQAIQGTNETTATTTTTQSTRLTFVTPEPHTIYTTVNNNFQTRRAKSVACCTAQQQRMTTTTRTTTGATATATVTAK
ncbi:uncharacterized protein LOC115564455 isoform X2 [Drosophila navojoa]|uniref:uncharacterized protein LOC115564455 isoform X2 n=1 Tax=Drosophila navojoa TaxID=7232 RepID=UPI0011BF9DCA|nr:uncharacterized protein LOC115564455 isoform X2 [Drosophila navojoa]